MEKEGKKVKGLYTEVTQWPLTRYQANLPRSPSVVLWDLVLHAHKASKMQSEDFSLKQIKQTKITICMRINQTNRRTKA